MYKEIIFKIQERRKITTNSITNINSQNIGDITSDIFLAKNCQIYNFRNSFIKKNIKGGNNEKN